MSKKHKLTTIGKMLLPEVSEEEHAQLQKQKELEARLAGTQQTIKIKLLGRKAFDDYKKEDYKTINGDYDGKNK